MCFWSHKYGRRKYEKEELFRQYDVFNGDTFLDYLKKIHDKFQKCYLFMDKASQHYKTKKVVKYFIENKNTLIPMYLPTASPEFMVMEEDLEHCQTRSICLKILFILCRFKE